MRATGRVDERPQDGPDARPPATPGTSHVLATAKGGGFLAAGTIFEYATRFVIGLLLARALGAHDYGLYVLTISVAALFAGISLIGTDDAMVRYVAIQSSRRDREGVAGTMQIGVATALIGGVVLGTALFLFAGPIAGGMFDSAELERTLRLVAVFLPFLTASSALLGMARGFKRMDYAAYAEKGVQSVVRLVLIAGLALAGSLTVVPAVVAFGLADVAAGVTLLILLDREFGWREVAWGGGRRDVREVFGFAFPLWIAGLLRRFRANIQNVLVGTLGTVAGVGVLSVANRINDVSMLSSQSVFIASRPLMAQLHDRGDHDDLRALYRTTTRWTLAANVPFFLVTALFPTTLLLVFGEQYARGATALVLVSCAQMISAATGTCQGMLDMTGHTRVKLANTIGFTALLIGGGALLIPRWGVVGAAASALIAIGTVNVVAVVEVWVLERLQPYDRTFVKPVVAALAVGAAGLALRAAVPPTTVAGGLVEAAIVGLAYLGLLFALGLEPEDRLVVERVRDRVRRRRAVTAGAKGSA